VAEVRERHGVRLVEYLPEGVPGGVRQLRRDRDADRPEPRGTRVVRAAVPRSPVVLEGLDGVDAADQRCRELPEGRPDGVPRPERPGAPDLRGLLSLEAWVDGQLALSL